MSRYELLVTLHVVAAILWLGAGATLAMLGYKAERSSDSGEMRSIAEFNTWLAPRLFIPSSVLVLLLGIALVLDGPWGFGDLWVLIGLGGYLASFLTGILFLEPEGKRINAAIAEHGPHSPQAQHHIRRILLVSRIELPLLYLVAADMIVKPSSDDVWTLLGGAAIFAAAIAGAFLVTSRSPGAPAAARADA